MHKRTAWIEWLCLLLLPVGMGICVYTAAERTAFTAFLLAVVSVGLLLWRFHFRRPRPRDLLPIVVLSAVAVAGRVAFAMLSNVKPVLAVTILAGVCFGPMSGFMTGALSALCSNMFFSQGTFTPWQMYAFGVCGYIAGTIFSSNRRQYGQWQIYAFGFFAGLLYGGIMDSYYVLSYVRPLTWQAAVLSYGQGLPHSLVHATATVAFLLLLYAPWRKKLLRIRRKFGIGDGERT